MNRYEKQMGYLVAVVACVAVLLVRLALREALAGRALLMPFVLAIMAAAWWGGRGPGVVATLLSTIVGTLFVVPPAGSMKVATLEDGLTIIIFVLVGLTISHLCEALHQARRAEAEKQFHTLADSIVQLVWMARPDGERFWFNQRWCDYSGATVEQLQHGGWQSFCEQAELPRVLQSWHAALQTGLPWEDAYPLRRNDGQMRWHLARAVPLRDQGGRITRWFGTSTDIQDRMATEQALREADLRKDQFLATLAHELRNPLTAISGALQFWPHAAADAAEMEKLRAVMSRQVKQLVRLIDDLLDVARITSGKIDLRRAPTDLRLAVAQAVETVQPLVDAAGHSLTITACDEPIYVHGDALRLTQVFANVLTNAAKYTPRGGAISVLAQKQDDQVTVRVRDNGAGIPTHLLTAIFDAFCQADRTLDSSHGGLGIGLTLAKQLVELHGGAIEAHSDGPGEGSEFVVTLPLLVVNQAAERSAQRPTPTPPIFSLRIVVVDDLRESAETLAKLLRSMGHDAVSLYDGEAAFDWMLAHRPDVAFLDIAMPGLDGYAVAQLVREHRRLDATVLIALTGFGQQEDRRRASEAGFDFHITKPAEIGELEELLLRLQEKKRPVTEPAASCELENIVFTEEAV